LIQAPHDVTEEDIYEENEERPYAMLTGEEDGGAMI